MDSKVLEEQIKALQSKIQDWEDTDPYYMNEEIKELRHKVMYVHMRIEASLESILVLHLVDWEKNKQSALELAIFHFRANPIFDKLEFVPKVQLCSEKHLIPGSLESKIHSVNNLRKIFAHPKSYERDIKMLENRQKYYEALLTLESAMDALNEYYSENKKIT